MGRRRPRDPVLDRSRLIDIGSFDPDPHTYALDGVQLPSVTQVLDAEMLRSFDHVPRDIRDAALYRGTYVHRAIHYRAEDDLDLDDVDPRFRGYLVSLDAYQADLKKRPLRDTHGHVCGFEFRFWHRRRMFAGTVDDVGFDDDGVLAIDDYKTGDPHDVSAALQTAAYESGLRESLAPALDYVGPIRRRAVRLFRDGSPGRPEPYADPRDLAMFYCALSLVHFRRNRCEHGPRVGMP
jgi:hypothetical protein